MSELAIEAKNIMELVTNRIKDYQTIQLAIEIQDRLRRKSAGKDSTAVIREWRDRR